MGDTQTVALGTVAGATILLGLPLGRLRTTSSTLRAFLNALATGVLLFLLWDVLTQAWEPVDAALAAANPGRATGDVALMLGGLAAALLGLAAFEGRIARGTRAGAAGPGAMARAELLHGIHTWSVARRTALLIATGIGLHNFAEGLAIGASSARDDIGLAAVLVIGFALHNATEGFGIVAPLAADRDRPLYVVIQLVGVGLRSSRWPLYAGVLAGLSAGFVTDMIVTAGGV